MLPRWALDARAWNLSLRFCGHPDSIAMTLLQQWRNHRRWQRSRRFAHRLRCGVTTRWFSPFEQRLLLKSAVMAALAVLLVHPENSWRRRHPAMARTFVDFAGFSQ
jgi:hypothetical protein